MTFLSLSDKTNQCLTESKSRSFSLNSFVICNASIVYANDFVKIILVIKLKIRPSNLAECATPSSSPDVHV